MILQMPLDAPARPTLTPSMTKWRKLGHLTFEKKKLFYILLFGVFSSWISIGNTVRNLYSHVSFSVHCPAHCAKENYEVFGTTTYRGVSFFIVE